MKKIKIFLLIICIVGVIFSIQKGYESYVLNQYGISQETREWMKKYEQLSAEERLYISYFPSDLAKAIHDGYDYKYAPEGMK